MSAVEVKHAHAGGDDYGEWLRVEVGGEVVYVWGCGCCSLSYQREEPKIAGEWAPYDDGVPVEAVEP